MEIFVNKVNKHFVTKLCNDISNEEEQTLTFRSNVNNDEEAKQWIKVFGNETHTEWIVNKSLHSPERLVYHKSWMCQHSKKNKSSASSQRCTNCKASIDVKIKKNNRNTRKNDSFLKLDPPLCAVIKVHNKHNHDIGTAGSLRYLRPSSEVKQQYKEYFESGLGPSEAIKLHQSKLIVQENAQWALANAALNPTVRSVHHMHETWRNDNFGAEANHLEMLEEENSSGSYENNGAVVKVEEETLSNHSLEEHERAVDELKEEVSRVASLISTETPTAIIQEVTKKLKLIQNNTHLSSAMLAINASLSRVLQTGGRQPTSSSRQRPGATRGSKTIKWQAIKDATNAQAK